LWHENVITHDPQRTVTTVTWDNIVTTMDLDNIVAFVPTAMRSLHEVHGEKALWAGRVCLHDSTRVPMDGRG
jgi:hypothetical protein